jgi:Mce-associated membrane protein
MMTLKDTAGQDETAESDATAEPEMPEAEDETTQDKSDENVTRTKQPIAWKRVLAYGVLPGLALALALGAGYLKWLGGSTHDPAALRAETIRIGSDDAVALLSYKADSVEKDLGAARERLTGDFKEAYSELTRQVVIPGAKEKHISAVAKTAAAASVSATDTHAVVLVFLNQTVTVGQGAPTDTTPVVKVVLDKVNDRWLVSHFDPV